MVYPDISHGNKYDEKLSVKDIAGKLREYIKEKNYKSLGIISITTKRYSGGRSLDIRITPNKNPYVFEPVYGATRGNANPEMIIYYIPEYAHMLDDIKREMAAYNFDGSDMMTDYYHVNFSGNVSIEDKDKWFMEIPQMEKNDKSLSELEQAGFKQSQTLNWVNDYGYKEMLARVI